MLATLAEQAPEGADWLFEIKYDGVRVLAARRGDAVDARRPERPGRHGPLPRDRRGAPRAAAFDRFLMDGEIVALDARGVSSFQRLQARMGLTRPGDVEPARWPRSRSRPCSSTASPSRATTCGALPLVTRKACLQRVLPPLGVARYGDHVRGRGAAFLEAAASRGSRASWPSARQSAYVARRSDAWLKIKCQRRQEFVIGGYTDPQGSRGPLRRAAPRPLRRRAPRLRVEGRHGLRRRRARAALGGSSSRSAGRRRRSTSGTPAGRGHHWVEPRLVARCASPSGPRTAGSATRRSSGSATTSAPRTAAARRRTLAPGPTRPSPSGPRPRRSRPRRPPRRPATGRARQRRRAGPPHQPRQGLLAGRGLHEGRSDPLLRRDRAADCCRTSATGRSSSRAIPTASPASRSSRRTRRSSRPTGCGPSGSTRRTPTARSTTSSWTTPRRCGTWSTWARSRSTLWSARRRRRSSGRTGSSSTSIPKGAPFTDVVRGRAGAPSRSSTSSSCRAT